MRNFIDDVIRHICAIDKYKGQGGVFLEDQFLKTLLKEELTIEAIDNY